MKGKKPQRRILILTPFYDLIVLFLSVTLFFIHGVIGRLALLLLNTKEIRRFFGIERMTYFSIY